MFNIGDRQNALPPRLINEQRDRDHLPKVLKQKLTKRINARMNSKILKSLVSARMVNGTPSKSGKDDNIFFRPKPAHLADPYIRQPLRMGNSFLARLGQNSLNRTMDAKQVKFAHKT